MIVKTVAECYPDAVFRCINRHFLLDNRYCVSDIPLRFRAIGERFLGRSFDDLETVRLG